MWDELNGIAPTMERYKGFYIPPGNDTFCQGYCCANLKCRECLFGYEEILKEYLVMKKRSEKLKRINATTTLH